MALSPCPDTDKVVLSYFLTGYPSDDKEIVNTALISKAFLNHPLLTRMRQGAVERLKLHHKSIDPKDYDSCGKAFGNCGYSLAQFPALKLPNPVPDYIQIDPKIMTHPVMIFKCPRGRTGLAMKLKYQDPANPGQFLETVLSIHSRDPTPNSFQVHTFTSSEAYNALRHGLEITDETDFDGAYAPKPHVLEKILNNQHPFFQLDGNMPERTENTAPTCRTRLFSLFSHLWTGS